MFQTRSLRNVAQDSYFKPQDLTCLLSIYFNPSSLQKAFSSPGPAIVWPSGHTKRRAPCRVQCGCLLLEMALKMLLTRMLRDLPGCLVIPDGHQSHPVFAASCENGRTPSRTRKFTCLALFSPRDVPPPCFFMVPGAMSPSLDDGLLECRPPRPPLTSP